MAGRLSTRLVAVEDFEPLAGEQRFDLAFANRVEALDRRHPKAGTAARERIRDALRPGGRLSIDGGSPVRVSPFD